MSFDEDRLNDFINFPGNKLVSDGDKLRRTPQLRTPMNNNPVMRQMDTEKKKKSNKSNKKKIKRKNMLKEKMTLFSGSYSIISIIIDAIIGFLIMTIISSSFATDIISKFVQGYQTIIATTYIGVNGETGINNNKKLSFKGIIIQMILFVIAYSTVKFIMSMN
jgi:hypothetical protein